jgi:hypothetical protein
MKSGISRLTQLLLGAAVGLVLGMAPEKTAGAGLLNADDYAHYVEYFNTMEPEEANYGIIRNAQAWDWMAANVPLFNCPDNWFEEIYYYRWWCLRKHIKYPSNYGYPGFGVTEFITWDNPNSSAFGHHVAEMRWLHNQQYLDQYALFFYRGNYGAPDTRFHSYSGWATDALYRRYLVTSDGAFLTNLLSDIVSDHARWESERMRPDGLFWQYDSSDSMEESISGSTTYQHVRPPLNSYMAANARALAKIALLANRPDIAATNQTKYETLRTNMIAAMWDDAAKFFKVHYVTGGLCEAREAIGFIPWVFNLPGPEHAQAWSQLADTNGFWAPMGLTTAERRSPYFRSHGCCSCEWDGAVWPFATSQTLDGLANMLRGAGPYYATKQNYFDAMLIYAQSHQFPVDAPGMPYLGEYLDEITGYWLKGPYSERSRYYNHSTFADLVISGLVGLIPREDNVVEVNPLVPTNSWDWFCLDDVRYHKHRLTILWDRNGLHYGRGSGLSVYCDGQLIANTNILARVTGALLSTPMEDPPAPPTGLIAMGGDGQVALSWNASAGATSYVVRRSTISDSGYVNVATNSTTTCTNTGLVNDTTYYFVVAAVNATGDYADSTRTNATPVGTSGSGQFCYDGFDYVGGTSVGGQTGGSGWSGAWQTKAACMIATNTATGLTYGNLRTAGGALQVGYPQPGVPGGSTTATPQRVLPATLGTMAATNGNVLWISFLMYNRVYPTMPGKYYRQSNLGLWSGASGSSTLGSEVLDLGMPNGSATVTTNFGVWTSPTASTPIMSSVPAFSTNVQLVVLRLNVDNTANIDTIYAWFNVNPSLLGNNSNTPGISTANLTNSAVDLSSVNALRFQAGNNNANGTNAFFTVDELRFGATFAAATPVTAVANTVPSLPAITNRTINVGTVLSIPNNATDTDTPAQTLTYSLPVAPANAGIGATSGVLNWRPLVTQANTTNAFSVVVTDSGMPSLSATQSFSVLVNPLALPSVTVPPMANGNIGLTVSGQVGPDYAVQASTNLFDWNTLFITNPMAMPFDWTDTNTSAGPLRFYRIKVGPPLP